jgi:hypothetical protein
MLVPAAGVADKMSQLMQCQAKASSVQDILQLLTCKGSSGKASLTAPAAAADDAGNPAAAALRGCLGTASSLLQAVTAHKKEVFQAWQVRLLDSCAASFNCSHITCYASASLPADAFACTDHCNWPCDEELNA